MLTHSPAKNDRLFPPLYVYADMLLAGLMLSHPRLVSLQLARGYLRLKSYIWRNRFERKRQSALLESSGAVDGSFVPVRHIRGMYVGRIDSCVCVM
jgi:hypothetical protein